VVVSGTTYRLTQERFSCRDLGAYLIRGIAQPVQLYRILASQSQVPPRSSIPGPHGRRAPLVGRQEEVVSLATRVEHLLAGRGGVTFVIGEVGVGKSRLIAEVRRRVEALDVLWLEGRALSFGQTLSYWPFVEIIKNFIGITDQDDEDTSWTKLYQRVSALFAERVVDILPYLETLLALEVRGDFAERIKYLDGQAMGYQIFRTMRHFISRLAEDRPLVLVFEDLHWADQSSATLLEHLLPLGHRIPLLLCGVSRPDPEGPAAEACHPLPRNHAQAADTSRESTIAGAYH